MAAGPEIDEVLYAKIEPYLLVCSQYQTCTLYFERAGNPNGQPVIVIHGGPEIGSQPSYRRYFDQEKFDIIQFDQRGCGKSTPYAELQENNTQNSVADIEALREYFGIDKWHVFGGSWGSTLSLIYAQNHPDKTFNLTLRSTLCVEKVNYNGSTNTRGKSRFPDAFKGTVSKPYSTSRTTRSYLSILRSANQ